jgi:cytoskeletal protein CcmA (bactofilin family)
MWNREESPRTGTSQTPPAASSSVQRNAPAVGDPTALGARASRTALVGSSVSVKGEISGSEDVTVDGHVEGRIDLPDHALTIGPNASVKADIAARIVTVFGSVVGRITARDKVEIRRGGSLEGPLVSARIAIQDGAHFCGKVEMPARKPKQDAEPLETVPTALAVAL